MSFLILLFFSLNLFNFIDSLATIKFKTFYPRRSNTKQDINQFNTQEFVESIVLSKIYFELQTGNETSEKNYKTQKLNIFTNSVQQSYFKSYEFSNVYHSIPFARKCTFHTALFYTKMQIYSGKPPLLRDYSIQVESILFQLTHSLYGRH